MSGPGHPAMLRFAEVMVCINKERFRGELGLEREKC